MARPPTFNDKLGKLIVELFKKGKTEAQVAKIIGVSRQALYNWKKKNPEFLYTIKEAKDVADELVIASLYARATGYNVIESKLTRAFGKKWIDKVEKHYPPDVAACIYWLNNRRPDEWRNSSRTELVPPNSPDTTPRKKKTFEEYCDTAGYPKPFPKQIDMVRFATEETVPRILLGAPGTGKTDYAVIAGTGYSIYCNWFDGLHKNKETADTTLLMTKSSERNKAILGEVAEGLLKNDVPLQMNNATAIEVEGLQGKEASLSSLTVKAVSLRGRHPKRAIMEDIVTEDDTSEATRKMAEKKYNELMKRTQNVLVVGQPAHKFDLYAKLRGILKKMEVPHGVIPELDHDLEAMAAAGVTLESISASYHLKIMDVGQTPFDKIKYLEQGAFPMPGTSVAFIDPSDGGNDTAMSVVKQYGQGFAVIGFSWQKRWDHALEDIVPLLKKYRVAKVCFETNKHGPQPVDLIGQVFAKLKLKCGIVGRNTTTEKHSRIMSAGTLAHLIHLSRESHTRFIDQVVQYEYKAKVDDAPDSLASCLEWIGVIKGKE